MERKVPMMNEATPPHTHNVHMTEKLYGGDGHQHHQKMYDEHAAGHMKEHDKVAAMCGGGMSYGKKK